VSKILNALTQNFDSPKRDSLWGHIYLTGALEKITKTEAFMKLHRIMQLGPVYLCYPGATHTRASHSLGVYHLTRRILLHLVSRGADSYLTKEGVFSMLCASLLHDLGHFPYTHSLKELPLLEHEKLSARLVLSEPLKSLIYTAGADAEMTAAIISPQEGGEESGELRFYRRLLSGVMDPDKLDYLNRDALYCGVPYGVQDVDFVISMLHPDREKGIVIEERGIPSVEAILFSKYLMYRSVYWHRRVRGATAMVKKALFEGLKDGVLCGEELYGLDDGGLFNLLKERRHSAFYLAQMVKEGRLFSCVKEDPFNEELHKDLLNLKTRAQKEEIIAKEASEKTGRKIPSSRVVIDVPEEVVFETDLFAKNEMNDFWNSSSFFKKDVVNAFVKTLRIVRVYIEDQ
jgi:HD superfamily phosphohydrolase